MSEGEFMTNASANPLQEISEAWASVYPLVQWMLDHPLGSLLAAFLGLYLFWGLLRGLIQLTENLWIKLLRSPVWVLQKLWQWTGQSRPLSLLSGASAPSTLETERDRLQALVNQLEEANQTQQDLIQQAKEVLKTMNTSE